MRDELPAGEKTVLDWVEKQGGRAEINKANGKAVAKVGDDFKSSVRKEGGGRYFKRNILHFVLGVVLSRADGRRDLRVRRTLSEEDFGLLIGMLFVGVFLSIFLVPIIAALFDGRGAMQLVTSLLSPGGGARLPRSISRASFLRDFAGEGGSIVTTFCSRAARSRLSRSR